MAKAEDGGPAIMAKLSGPGPAKYYLKGTCGYMNHDASKPRSPAYKLSARVWPSLAKQDGPGPAAYFVPPKVIRMGRDGYPSYSLYGRHQEVKIFCTPAPDAYAPEQCPPTTVAKAPSYSFGIRTALFSKHHTPAPNTYGLPTMIGFKSVNKTSVPSYSLTGRSKIGSFHQDTKKTPGPGTYNAANPNVYKFRNPLYSISARNALPSDSTRKPGPGAHYPEKVFITRRLAPQFSFGIRHSDYKAPILDVADV
ncbi:ciliary microtubule associated protein 1A-like [Corticium candelabrum]|uniref:ciliary microtubule associated protein 1A-like n=1 Tax=Corticium candelabrum TaxID=121492 RepID=UPI002E263B7A|nr:ciliary microtubule associated protein 1A-like [Corticium candelabrum]